LGSSLSNVVLQHVNYFSRQWLIVSTYDQIKKEIDERIAKRQKIGPDEKIIRYPPIPGIPGIPEIPAMPAQYVIVKEVMIRGKAAQIDSSIADHIKRINEAGLFTLASCSGLDRDHIRSEELSAYLTIRVGEKVVIEGGYFNIPPGHEGVDWELVKKLEDVGKKSGWTTNVHTFYRWTPAVSFYIPHMGTIKNDETILAAWGKLTNNLISMSKTFQLSDRLTHLGFECVKNPV